ncbi:MAG: hydrolase [Gemmatimonadetes bacterium]|nr:hydrolase [Gemmatimonadota bacterium]
MANSIRIVAGAICRHGDRILLERGYDPMKAERFYRVIGGGVEFGELASDAVVREWQEELGLALEQLELLGVLENRFTYRGEAGHEVVFLFSVRIVDARALARDEFQSVDTDGNTHDAVWVSIDELRARSTPVYPAGVLELLGTSMDVRASFAA